MCTISFIFRSETLIRLGEMCPNITSLSLICCDENYRKNHYMWSYMRDCSFISAFPALNSLYLFRTLVKLITCFHKFLNVRIQDYFFHNFFPTRGHSMTTWTQFCPFLTTTYLYMDIFNPERGQK